jgi:hypothetical protein
VSGFVAEKFIVYFATIFANPGYIVRDSGGPFKIIGHHGGGGVKEEHRLCVLSGVSPDVQEGKILQLSPLQFSPFLIFSFFSTEPEAFCVFLWISRHIA